MLVCCGFGCLVGLKNVVSVVLVVVVVVVFKVFKMCVCCKGEKCSFDEFV